MSERGLSDPRLQRAADAIRAGRTIEAIKHLRDATGMTLKEAKDTVERLMEEQGMPPTAVAGGEPELSMPGVTPHDAAPPVSDAAATDRRAGALLALIIGVVLVLLTLFVMMM